MSRRLPGGRLKKLTYLDRTPSRGHREVKIPTGAREPIEINYLQGAQALMLQPGFWQDKRRQEYVQKLLIKDKNTTHPDIPEDIEIDLSHEKVEVEIDAIEEALKANSS
jgi:hypothetical protein